MMGLTVWQSASGRDVRPAPRFRTLFRSRAFRFPGRVVRNGSLFRCRPIAKSSAPGIRESAEHRAFSYVFFSFFVRLCGEIRPSETEIIRIRLHGDSAVSVSVSGSLRIFSLLSPRSCGRQSGSCVPLGRRHSPQQSLRDVSPHPDQVASFDRLSPQHIPGSQHERASPFDRFGEQPPAESGFRIRSLTPIIRVSRSKYSSDSFDAGVI